MFSWKYGLDSGAHYDRLTEKYSKSKLFNVVLSSEKEEISKDTNDY